MRCQEGRQSEDQRKAVSIFYPELTTITEVINDGSLAQSHFGFVDCHRASIHAIIGGTARQISDSGTRNHGLARCTAFIYAGSTDVLPLDEGGIASGLRQSQGKRSARLPGADQRSISWMLIPGRRRWTVR